MSRPSTPEYLVVIKISWRASPLSRMAIPASASFRYSCAVSGIDEDYGYHQIVSRNLGDLPTWLNPTEMAWSTWSIGP